MDQDVVSLRARIGVLEREVRLTWYGIVAAVLFLVLGAVGRSQEQALDSIRAHRITVVDDQGRPRIVLGEDPVDTQRRSRSCGLVLIDTKGAERFGVGTFADLSVVLGMDAPHGVGSPMPDRIGMGVDADGSAHVMLIDNQTLVPVRLVSDAEGGGGLELIGYDLEKEVATVERHSLAGVKRTQVPLGDGR